MESCLYEIENLKPHIKKYLEALLKEHRTLIQIDRNLRSCSLDLDSFLRDLKIKGKQIYAQDNRWDYIVSILTQKHECLFFVEVHGADKISEMEKKYNSLKKWLQEMKIIQSQNLKLFFYWIPSGNVPSFPPYKLKLVALQKRTGIIGPMGISERRPLKLNC